MDSAILKTTTDQLNKAHQNLVFDIIQSCLCRMLLLRTAERFVSEKVGRSSFVKEKLMIEESVQHLLLTPSWTLLDI